MAGSTRLGVCCLALLFVTWGIPGCSDPSNEELATEALRWTGDSRASNLILIVSDAMRRDRVGTYGGPARTPVFDAFASENLVFDTAYSQAPWTKPAMVTLFTSLYPSQHGLLSHPSLRSKRDGPKSFDLKTDFLSQEFTTLSEVLQSNGFRTAAFMSNPWMRKEFGFDQGFELYDDSLASWHAPGSVVTEKGLDWLETVAAGQRFFLYLHYVDAHRPYGALTRRDIGQRGEDLRADTRPLDSRSQMEIARVVRLEDGVLAAKMGIPPSITLAEMAYDRGVEDFDQALGLFLEGFQSHDAYEQTAILVVSDHGEALFTRGWGNHGGALYEDEVAIPLAARLPGVSAGGSRINSPVGLVDLMPTLCTYLDVEVPDDVVAFGRNWLEPSTRNGKLRDRYLVTEGVMNRPQSRAIRHHGHKAFWQPVRPKDRKERALFRITEDPGEVRDLLTLADGTQSALDTYEDLLRGGRDVVSAFVAPERENVPLGDQVVKRLRSLGYIE